MDSYMFYAIDADTGFIDTFYASSNEPILIEKFTLGHLSELPKSCDVEYMSHTIKCLLRLADGTVMFCTDEFEIIALNVARSLKRIVDHALVEMEQSGERKQCEIFRDTLKDIQSVRFSIDADDNMQWAYEEFEELKANSEHSLDPSEYSWTADKFISSSEQEYAKLAAALDEGTTPSNITKDHERREEVTDHN